MISPFSARDEEKARTFQLTPIYHNISMRRSLSKDIYLAAASEIQVHFKRLDDPDEFIDAIEKLTHFSNCQRFTVSAVNFDKILKVFINQRFIKTEQTVKDIIHLLYHISTFQPFFIESGIRLKHIAVLHRLLPTEEVFKILANILTLNRKYLEYFLSLGFDSFINQIDEQKIPIFIWFLGCFAYYPEFNSILIPYYESFVINGIIGAPPKQQKHSLNVFTLLFSQKSEMSDYILSKSDIRELCQHVYPQNDCLKQFISFLKALIERGNSEFVLSTPELPDAISQCFVHGFEDLIVSTVQFLGLLVQNGFFLFVYNNDFSRYMITIAEGTFSFVTKKITMLVLCWLFSKVPKATQENLIKLGLCNAISLAFNADDKELRTSGLQAFEFLLQNHQNNQICDPVIDEILGLLSCDEYDAISPFLSEN